MLAIPPFGASSNIALWRANIKPPVELVVDDLEKIKLKKGKRKGGIYEENHEKISDRFKGINCTLGCNKYDYYSTIMS